MYDDNYVIDLLGSILLLRPLQEVLSWLGKFYRIRH